MTILTITELSNIAANRFNLDFVRAKLVQQKPVDPQVYDGAGSIFQDNAGALQLKLYISVADPQTLISKYASDINDQGLVPGQIVADDYYFSFEGVDIFGQAWTASDLAIKVNTGLAVGGHVVHSTRLSQIENRRPSDHAGGDRSTLIVPGSFEIPFTTSQPGTQETGFSACTLSLGGGTTASLKRRNGSLVVDLVHGGDDPSASDQRILEAIGIAAGAHLRPQVELSLAEGQRVQVVHSLASEAARMRRVLPPVPLQAPNGFPDFEALVVGLLDAFEQPYGEMAGYWFRVLSTQDNSLENQALVLSTAIEGVLKAYFADETKPDREFIEELTLAKPAVKGLEIGARARERLLSSLGSGTTPTATNALYALEEQGRLPVGLRVVWKELRNKMSHADELTWTGTKRQLFLNDMYGCLELFYRLLMLHIEYKGRLNRFSQPGWPVTEQMAGNGHRKDVAAGGEDA